MPVTSERATAHRTGRRWTATNAWAMDEVIGTCQTIRNSWIPPTGDAGGHILEQHGASGLDLPQQEAVDEVADATVKCLLRAVPAAVPGIAFLSGGQSGELASARLNAMNVRFKSRLPWALAFSFARAIQQPALEIWRGEDARVLAAQQVLAHRGTCNRAARRGEYNAAMERT